MKDLSGGDLTSIDGSWSTFLVDSLLERSGATQFMKPQQSDSVNSVIISFSLTGTDVKGIMKDLSGGDLTSIGGSWSSFLVDNLLERSGAAQFMKPQQCDRDSDKYFPAVNGWKSGKIQF